jgi:hypothetical protein
LADKKRAKSAIVAVLGPYQIARLGTIGTRENGVLKEMQNAAAVAKALAARECKMGVIREFDCFDERCGWVDGVPPLGSGSEIR